MTVNVEKLDEVNYKVNATIDSSDIDSKLDKLAKDAAKTIKVDGFRKGKVPPAVVKKMYGDSLKKDAEGECVREALESAYKEANIDKSKVLGQPIFEKYEDNEDKKDIEIIVSLKPEFELGDYSDIIPEYEKPEASEEEIEEELKNIANQFTKAKKIKEDRALQEDDVAVFDFEGFIDGEPFEGGKAEKYELKIGSKQFIEGFEEQMIGMKKGEEKTIKVTFPSDYQAENLAGKEAEFKITLHEIKKEDTPEIGDELAKQALGKPDATLDELKEHVVKMIVNRKLSSIYQDELKPKLLENIVEKYNFDLPQNIVEQEIDNLANQKAQELSKEEIEEIRNSEEKLKELRESVREDAIKSVKATFIVDALAKAEEVDVSDGEISQAVYYEALMAGQDPQKVMEYYTANNLLPVLKMGMIEDKLFAKLLKLEEDN